MILRDDSPGYLGDAIPRIRNTPYYLGQPLPGEMQPAGEVTTEGDTGVPDPAPGAEQDPGAFDTLAEIQADTTRAIVTTGVLVIATAGLLWWATSRDR